MGLSNTIEGAHTGHGFNGSVGWFYPVQRRWIDVGLKLNVSHGGLSVGLGEGESDSNISATTWGVGPMANIHLVPRWLDVSASLLLGSKHLKSDGTVFADNPRKIHVDDSKDDSDLKSGTGAFNLGIQLCAGIPALYDGPVQIGLKACYERAQSGHDFKINYASGQSAPAEGVDSAENKFLTLLDFRIPLSTSDRSEARYAEYRAQQAREEAERARAAEEAAAAAKAKEAEKPKEAAKPAPVVVPEGTKPEVKAAAEKAGEIKQDVATSLGKKHGEAIKALAGGINTKAAKETEKAESYDRAQEVVKEYKASKAEYDAAAAKLAALEKTMGEDPIKSMKDEEKKVAVEAVAAAKAEVEKLKADVEANQKAALEAVQNFYKISSLGAARNKWATDTIAELGGKKK